MNQPSLPEPRRMHADAARGGSFSYLFWDGPASLPLLHFAHANGFNAQTYRLLLAPLAQDFRIIAWDARGHGQSTLPADPAKLKSWDRYRDDLIGFLSGFGEPMWLAGHSLGATTSLVTAAANPKLVKGLVLAEPVLMPRSFMAALDLLRMVGLGHRINPLAEGAGRRRPVFDSRQHMIDAYRGRGAFKTWRDGSLEDYVAGGSHIDGSGQARLACAPAWEQATFMTRPPRLWWRIKQLAPPVTLLRGTRGSTCPPQSAEAFRRLKPGIKIQVIEGASHFLPIEHPDPVRQAIREMALPPTPPPGGGHP